MYPVILIQFRMKCQSILLFILYSYNVSIHLSQYFCAFPTFFNIRGTNECHGNLTDSFHFPDGVKTAKLSAIGIAADDTLAVTLPMKQLTRRLTLKMKLAGGNPGILAGTEASITGIAPALDIAALKLQGDPATVRPVFVREGDVLTAELNLLGTAADVRQEFIIVLIATDGQRQTLARDMTGALSDFNRGTDPMTLDATLELMNDALPDADITDWVPSGSEEGDAV